MNSFIESTPTGLLPCSSTHALRSPMAGMRAKGGRHALRRAMGALLVTVGLGFVAPQAHALDVNQANAQQLETIRGIGPRTAEVIIAERDRGGKFESFEDLAERVRGIGQKKAQALQAAGLQVGDGEPSSAVGKGASGSATEVAKPGEAKPATGAGAGAAAKSGSRAAGKSAGVPAGASGSAAAVRP
ncbi:MAG: ComEA family DNA-binding protein [Achromobacter kerstersii]|uniref:ComEA family DNA-binding protein n=1 Tax=Achromobacter kerstersii TaxID=1353890 RepID=UPI003D035A2A